MRLPAALRYARPPLPARAGSCQFRRPCDRDKVVPVHEVKQRVRSCSRPYSRGSDRGKFVRGVSGSASPPVDGLSSGRERSMPASTAEVAEAPWARVSSPGFHSRYTRTGSAMFLTVCSPRFRKRVSTFPLTAVRMDSDTAMPPGSARPSSRAAMLITHAIPEIVPSLF